MAVPHIFISYPENNRDIVGNFRGRLKEYGVDTWAYSHDKTLGKATWKEIKNKINNSKVIIFVVSEYTKKAKGQHRELTLALNKIIKAKNPSTIFPIGQCQVFSVNSHQGFILNGFHESDYAAIL